MKKMHVATTLLLLGAAFIALTGETCSSGSSDDLQQQAQEKLLLEANAKTGMPSIINFRERKLLKLILELRDQEGLVTWTYTFSEVTGKLTFLGESIGYGLPYATQYTNPEKLEYYSGSGHYVLPQADPNGLFSPSSAEGTWVLLKDPNSSKVAPIYVEPRVVVSPFKLTGDNIIYPGK
ncbi:MAG: hypothetical protein V1846_03905 [Candidatus Komeilibacteria bacterium]